MDPNSLEMPGTCAYMMDASARGGRGGKEAHFQSYKLLVAVAHSLWHRVTVGLQWTSRSSHLPLKKPLAKKRELLLRLSTSVHMRSLSI